MFDRCSSLSSFGLFTFNTSSVGPDDLLSGWTDMLKEFSNLKGVHAKDERIKSKLPSGVSVKTKWTYNTTYVDSLTHWLNLL